MITVTEAIALSKAAQILQPGSLEEYRERGLEDLSNQIEAAAKAGLRYLKLGYCDRMERILLDRLSDYGFTIMNHEERFTVTW